VCFENGDPSEFEVKMVIKRKKGPGEVGKIKIEKEGDEKEEIAVLHKTLIQKDEGSVWSWLEEFTTEWSETFITKKKKRNVPP
jgi:hypothetical protein